METALFAWPQGQIPEISEHRWLQPQVLAEPLQ
ncbi:hypothetical protein SCHAM137S_06567 [Streptomyces chartreusis]